MMLSLHRLLPGGEAAATDTMMRLLLNSVEAACRTMLKPSESAFDDRLGCDKIAGMCMFHVISVSYS